MKHLILVCILLIGCSQKEIEPKVTVLDSPTTSLLQAISIVDDQTVWISGHNATIVRSIDGGKTWDLMVHPTGDSLQFRDIHAFDENLAVLMSAGPGPLSRIFTLSNDTIWEENFVMQDSLGFLDCIDFWDGDRGIAYGDAIDDYPYILLTKDGGKNWERAPLENMPKAGTGEGGFAASGTCVTTGENGRAWIATGANNNSRILLTEDHGQSWDFVESPVLKGEAAGNTSISFTGKVGFVTGGDLLQADNYTDNCAFSLDDGESWTLSQSPITKGAFYGGSITTIDEKYFAFACGPNGLDYTSDLGQSWNNLDTLNYWAVSFLGKAGYVSGRDGRILKITLQQ